MRRDWTKVFLSFCGVAVLGFFGLGKESQAKVFMEQGKGVLNYHVTIDDTEIRPVTIDDKDFYNIVLHGIEGHEGILYKIGNPELPVVRFYFDEKPTIKALREGTETRELPDGLKIKPSQPSLEKFPGATVPFTFNNRLYETNAFFPAKIFDVEKAGSIRGKTQYLVTLYPVSYNPFTDSYKTISDFVITVPMSTIRDDDKAKKDTFVFIIGQNFVNSPSLAEYKALKRSIGYDVREIVVGSQMSTADQIRAKLKQIYAEPTVALRYALIIGDSDDVPGKPGANISDAITDHYYRAIDTNDYEGDINGPDIGVGRIAVQNESQLAIVLKKYSTYQRGVFSDESWLDGVSFIATNDKYEVAEGTHNYAINTYTSPLGYVGVFPNANMQGGDQLYAITHHVSDAKVVETMKLGRTIINYSGHGGPTSWAGPNVSQSDVRSLNHSSALPFVISNACLTGEFTMDESFGETWQRHPAGAIMFWGAMVSTLWDEDDILERRMYDGIYRDGLLSFADITDFSMKELWKAYGGAGKSKYYWEAYVTFGDPSIKLRTKRPTTVNIQGPEVLLLGLNTVEYTLLDGNNAPLKNARIALGLTDGSYVAAATTDQNGYAKIVLEQGTEQLSEYKVVIYGDNTKLAQTSLKVIPSDSAYLKFSEFKLNGRDEDSVYLGETVELGFKVENIGKKATQGGSVAIQEISGPGTFAEADSESLNIPAIAPGESKIISAGPKFKVNSEAIPGEAIQLKISWNINEGQKGLVGKLAKVLRGLVKVSAMDFGNPSQPDEGGIKPGANGSVYVTVANTGNEVMHNLTMNPTVGTCLESIGGNLSVDSLAPGAFVRITSPVSASVLATCKNGDLATAVLNGTYQSQVKRISVTDNLQFVIGKLGFATVDVPGINKEIPDGGDPIVQPLEIQQAGTIKDLGLKVYIAHPYIGDLIVKLIHPDGTEVTLHDRTGGSDDDINLTYGLGGVPTAGLARFNGKPSNGIWKLSVQDKAKRDVGTLKDLKLTIKVFVE